ncbi:leucine--tRNA ligase [Mycoplasmoides pneumoniae]|uniref:leucine--tRNA ligase n=1 Tax=Mycoplasmoides pneumoniae TaxID=2104 RepID=UPI0002B84642|nr:leucine--tRNA ligase [Mycoplasmoides pneumoniae]AGC04292.1 leucyl-tRNA synthetase [Mycoplasmoides pneumoniae M129-B7]ALA30263.1 leucyl-tRNA synthetase [Mycoplasmoides pneumoniae PI 1428]ALA32371.1 leucyl-tRNA synthetase [Mycoplasmoides pneumoniae 51494]ALA33071.1 leucyl-tRNA synthetase [Mycoplasmoides pneumoniae 54089]ALA33775.1 leucyl-tRNA synthetase [Mycoplasmoides pneumoniae 54524]
MYNHNLLEEKWLQLWKTKQVNRFFDDKTKPKYYILDMFPYPSAAGLHLGHVRAYTITDVLSRYHKAKGFNVIHPIGFDAFGLPAEQYAIASNKHPGDWTDKNITNFIEQLTAFGFDYDYQLSLKTTDPRYYQYTQWIFGQLFEAGLAEVKEIDVNWCAELGTVLANEEVLIDSNGNAVSERGEFPVTKRKMKQWVLKITAFAESLLNGLAELDWHQSIKEMQTNWIGKSEGVEVTFDIENSKETITIFTTKVQTIFGVTFLALSNSHPLVKEVAKTNPKIAQFLQKQAQKTTTVKQPETLHDGVDLKLKAINPATNTAIPLYVANYVVEGYGTDAVMGVPAHNENDNFFARKQKLPIITVIDKQERLQHSGQFSGLNSQTANTQITQMLVERQKAKKTTVYKLRDWIFSRQRYWGEPFPILFDENNQPHLVKELPVTLPALANYQPDGSTNPPLWRNQEWAKVKQGNQTFTRETSTMPQWAGSCWYYLGYLMLINNENFWPIDSREAKDLFERYLPVDLYVGGAEHAVLHLLYARFWHQFLYQKGIVTTKEPFKKLINQGMVLGPDGKKMSKSKGNTINPTPLIDSHGADALRLYLMFMGPISAALTWLDDGLNGMRRWLDRVHNFFHKENIIKETVDQETVYGYNLFLKRSYEHLEKQELNLVISQMMIFLNLLYKTKQLTLAYAKGFLTVLSFFAPYLAEELNAKLGMEPFIVHAQLPNVDNSVLETDKVKIILSVNGRFKGTKEFAKGVDEQTVLKAFKTDPEFQALFDQPLARVVFVPNRIINVLLKSE